MAPKFPLKFILLWVINLALLLTLTLSTGLLDKLSSMRLTDWTWIFLAAGFLLAGAEQALWDKLRGND